MKTKLLSKVAAIAAAGILLFGISAPVLAEEMVGSIDGADTGNLTSIDFYKQGYPIRNVTHFTGDDGVIYYSTETSRAPMGDQNALYKELFGDFVTGPKFMGLEPGGNAACGPNVLSHWNEVGKIMQLNMGFVKMEGLDQEGYGVGSGQETGNSLRDAENQVMNSSVNNIKETYKQRALQNETRNQFVVATVEEYAPRNSTNPDNYACVATYLYNFRVSPLMTNEYLEWAAKNGKAGIQDSTKRNSSAKLGVNNDSPLVKTDQQQISVGIDESSTKEKNGSDTYSFAESAKISAKTKFGTVEAAVELGFTATQAFSSGWKDSSSVSYKDNKSTTQSVTMLPYSGVNMANTVQTGDYTQSIDFPVAISYDVKIVNYGQRKNVNANVMATFEGSTERGSIDAQSDLYQRYFKQKENQGIKYEGDKYKFSVEDVISMSAKTAPYFISTSTKFNGKVSDAVSITSGFIAMHPLSSIDTTKGFRDLKMKPNQTVACRDIPIKGYLNSKYPDGKGGTGEYTAFSADRGHWEVTTGSDVVKLVTDGQGRQKIQALKEGKASIIYKIDEKAYNSQDNREHFTTNSELTATAELEINVSQNGGQNPELINKALHQLEDGEQGWTVDNGYMLGNPDGEALTDIQIPTVGLDGMGITVKGNPLNGGYESVSMKIEGINAKGYDVYYRAYVQDLGWMSWAQEDQLSGTSGFDKNITAVQVMVLESNTHPTINDAITPAHYMENENVSDTNIIFAAMKNAKLNPPAESVE